MGRKTRYPNIPSPATAATWWAYFEKHGTFHPERVAWADSFNAAGVDIPAGGATNVTPMLGAMLQAPSPAALGIALSSQNAMAPVANAAMSSVSPSGFGAALAAQGGAGAGAGAGAAAFPWGFAIAAGFMLYGIIGRSNPKDQRTQGYGFQFRDNPADPNDPIALWYGYPVVTPPVLFSYLTSDNLNSRSPSKGQRFVTCLSLGGGPVDGRDLQLWMNGRRMLGKVKDTDPAASRTMTKLGDSGKEWIFPVGNVKPSSVVIYSNGTAIAAAAGESGTTTQSAETQVTGMTATVRTFDSDDDSDIATGATRYGCYLPQDGVGIRDITLKVRTGAGGVGSSIAQKCVIRRWRIFGSGRTTEISRNSSATFTEASASWSSPIRVGTTDDGDQYLYVNVQSGGELIAGFTLTYKIKPTVKIENRGGTWVAVFVDAQTPTLTWSGETSELGEDLKLDFRPGTAQQDPLPVDGIRTATALGDELTQGTTRTYTTPDDVDDVELVLESSAAGFYDHAISGGNACDFRPTSRKIQVRIRENGAGNSPATKNDPATGWVTLGHPDEASGVETESITIQSDSGGNTGTARWFLSVADLLAAKQGKNADFTTGHNLPKRVAYDISVVGLDKENAGGGDTELDRIRSELFLAAAQDIRRVKMSLPYHSTLTLQIDDLEDLPAEPVFKVQCAGRQVWVPSAGATYSSDTERLESGSLTWSRNPVWCSADIITNPVFGGGEWYGWANIDATKALAAAAFCDVDDFYGSDGEPFAELDIALTRRSAMWDHVAQACAGARILPAMSGGIWQFEIDQDSSSVMTITEDDIIYQSASLQLPGVEEIPTDIEAAFTDEEQDFDLDTELRSREGEPAQRVVRRVDLTGVRRRAQVIRAADLALRQFNLNRRAIRVAGHSWRLLLLEPGDIVTLTNTVTGDSAAKYRVMGTAWGAGFLPQLELAEHDPAAYESTFNPFRIVSSNRPPAAPPSGQATTSDTATSSPYVVRNTSTTATLRRLTATRIKEAS